MPAAKDFITIAGLDWEAARRKLDPWLARLNARLDAQEGRSGTPGFYDDIDMKSHAILNGPDQTDPEDTEFITRAYADATYAGGSSTGLRVGTTSITTVGTTPGSGTVEHLAKFTPSGLITGDSNVVELSGRLSLHHDQTIWDPVVHGQSYTRCVHEMGGTNDTNEFGAYFETSIYPTASAGSYEKGALFAAAYTSDPSTGGSITRDAVGADIRGICNPTNANGRIWGMVLGAYTQTGGDATSVGLEIDCVNEGTDVATMDVVYSKCGISIVAAGSHHSTAGIYMAGASGAKFHKGIFTRDSAFVGLNGDTFIELTDSVGPSRTFAVLPDGQTLVGLQSHDATTDYYNSTYYGALTVRESFTVFDGSTNRNILFLLSDYPTTQHRIVSTGYDLPSPVTRWPITIEVGASTVAFHTYGTRISASGSAAGSDSNLVRWQAVDNGTVTRKVDVLVTADAGSANYYMTWNNDAGDAMMTLSDTGGITLPQATAGIFSDAGLFIQTGSAVPLLFKIGSSTTNISFESYGQKIYATGASAGSDSNLLRWLAVDNGAVSRKVDVFVDADAGSARYYMTWNNDGGSAMMTLSDTGGITLPQSTAGIFSNAGLFIQTGTAIPLLFKIGSGSTNITFTTAGQIQAASMTLTTALAAIYGGTGQTGYTTGDVVYASGASAISKLAIGTSGQVLTVSGGLPAWATTAASISGTANRVAKFATTTTLGNSNISDDGTTITLTGVVLMPKVGSTAGSNSVIQSFQSVVSGPTTRVINQYADGDAASARYYMTWDNDGGSAMMTLSDLGGITLPQSTAGIFSNLGLFIQTGSTVPLLFKIGSATTNISFESYGPKIFATSASAGADSNILRWSAVDNGSVARKMDQYIDADAGSARYYMTWTNDGGTAMMTLSDTGGITLPQSTAGIFSNAGLFIQTGAAIPLLFKIGSGSTNIIFTTAGQVQASSLALSGTQVIDSSLNMSNMTSVTAASITATAGFAGPGPGITGINAANVSGQLGPIAMPFFPSLASFKAGVFAGFSAVYLQGGIFYWGLRDGGSTYWAVAMSIV